VGNSITGIDVSSWQHEDGVLIDWEAVHSAGHRFVIVKATQGVSYVNPWIARDLSDAWAAGLLLGAYHYFEAGEDPAQQAKWFTSCLVGQPLDLGVFIDWECYMPAKFVHTQELTQFLTEVRMTRPQCGVYCSADWAAMLQEENVALGRLWVADCTEKPPFSHFMWQREANKKWVAEHPATSEDVIDNVRGLDIPTSPPERPTASTTHSVKDAVEAEAGAAEEETSQPDEHEEHE
jgi:GH25 family lysozyme M1 (1,4-beta-N-acetylmuramidase)